MHRFEIMHWSSRSCVVVVRILRLQLIQLQHKTAMPTRISLKQTPPRSHGSETHRLPRTSPLFAVTRSEVNNDELSPPPSPIRTRRSHTSFRSSFLRDFTSRDRDEEALMERLSTDDIRASPRLLGYFLSMIAGGVMLASVVQYVRKFKVFFR